LPLPTTCFSTFPSQNHLPAHFLTLPSATEKVKTLTEALKTLTEESKSLTEALKVLTETLKTVTEVPKSLTEGLKKITEALKNLTETFTISPENEFVGAFSSPPIANEPCEKENGGTVNLNSDKTQFCTKNHRSLTLFDFYK